MEEYLYLIECVRQHPCLWNTKLPNYKKNVVKDEAWRDVAKKTNLESAAVAKTKWKNLRDTHRETLKKINKNKSKRSQKKIKTWKYMSHMEFLLPHMYNHFERDTNETPPPDFSPSAEKTSNIDNTNITQVIPTPEKKSKEETNTEDDDGLYKLFKKMEDNRENLIAERDELRKELTVDPLKAFFDSMYQSTRQMPEFYQRVIKRKLFQLVMEAEDNIANTTVNPTISMAMEEEN